MRKIRLVLEYRLGKNISADQTAAALSISKGSVINYMERFDRSKLVWPLPDTFTDTELEAALFPPDNEVPAEGLPDINYIEKELAKPHMTLQRLWEEYAQLHPGGLRRSTVYEYVAHSRPPKTTMKIIHKGGDKVFVDYSGDGLEYIDLKTGECIPNNIRKFGILFMKL